MNLHNYDIISEKLINDERINYFELSENHYKKISQGKKAPSILTIDKNKFPKNVLLSLYFYIHRHIDDSKEALELGKVPNFIEDVRISNTMGVLDLTVRFYYVEDSGVNPAEGVILSLFNNEKYIVMKMQ